MVKVTQTVVTRQYDDLGRVVQETTVVTEEEMEYTVVPTTLQGATDRGNNAVWSTMCASNVPPVDLPNKRG